MQAPSSQSSIWRIAYIPHTAPGGAGYVRAYGWGYLSWPGIVMVIAGTAGMMLGSDAPWKIALIASGFALTLAGAILNGLSERRRMPTVQARCVDVEIQHLGGIHMWRSAGHAVRARMRYSLEGREYEATPGQFGYDLLGSREAAETFARYLKSAATVPLLVDARHPTRALFKTLIPPSAANQPSR
ncbi:MAG TPA: hypothetical protein VGE57_03915 [Solimonas sp.]